jgi:hypothetical protein
VTLILQYTVGIYGLGEPLSGLLHAKMLKVTLYAKGIATNFLSVLGQESGSLLASAKAGITISVVLFCLCLGGILVLL